MDKMRRCAANPGPRCAGRAFWGLPLNGVAVTEQGIIYVAGCEANVVYRIVLQEPEERVY